MRTGMMRRTVTLRTNVQTANPMGGYTDTPTDIENIPARVSPLQGQEQVDAMQTGMQRPHRFTMRFRDGMTGATQILYDGRTFDIKSVVDPEERHRELQILADEVGAV